MHRRNLIAACLASALPLGGYAQTAFPSKPLTIIVPATPGGAIDLTARLTGAKISTALGKPVSIENLGGAGGTLGTDRVAKAAPDGHALVLVASSHAINPSMYKKLPFDTIKGFEPVIHTHTVPLVLVVSNTVPARSLSELVAYLKANPGKSSFASSGKGGAPHMSGELFKAMAGVDLVHVPYKGSSAAHTDLVAGRVEIMFDTVAAIAAQVKGGNVRALAVTTATRSGVFPDLPTMAEAGLNGYETSTWGGLLAPAGTPKDVVARLNAEANKALASPDMREKLAAAGIEPAGGTPAQFGTFIQSEMVRWAKVAKSAGLEPE
jgi:tripartite-type tricarboxylate transporter receptor subunit TctC